MIYYPEICNPQITSFDYEQPTNNSQSSQIVYALNSKEDIQKPRVAITNFIFTKDEFMAFLGWYYIDLQNGLKSFLTDWKDFGEVFFTKDSKMEITKKGEAYTISGLKIETVKNFGGGR